MSKKLAAIGNGIYWVYDRAITGLIYFTLYLIITAVAAGILIGSLESVLPDDQRVVFTLLGLSALPGIVFFYWGWRGAKWRRENPELYEAEKAAKEAKIEAARDKAENAPPGPVDKVIIGLIESVCGLLAVAFFIALGALVLYLGYLLIVSMPVSLAIIVGAVIIGLCVLATRR